jgi:hypothetical protein
MFRASLCPSSGEQEQDWLKLHVKMPAVEQQLSKSAHCLHHGSTQPQPAQPGIFT